MRRYKEKSDLTLKFWIKSFNWHGGKVSLTFQKRASQNQAFMKEQRFFEVGVQLLKVVSLHSSLPAPSLEFI